MFRIMCSIRKHFVEQGEATYNGNQFVCHDCEKRIKAKNISQHPVAEMAAQAA